MTLTLRLDMSQLQTYIEQTATRVLNNFATTHSEQDSLAVITPPVCNKPLVATAIAALPQHELPRIADEQTTTLGA